MPRRDIAKTSGAVSVTTSSTAVAAVNLDRESIDVVNDGTSVVYLKLTTTIGTAPTATTHSGVRLNASGGSWSSTVFTGAVAGIGDGGTSICTVTEI